MLWVLVIVGSFIAACGDALLKRWVDDTSQFRWLIGGIFVYVLEVFFFAGCMKYRSMAQACGVFVLGNALFGVLLGILYYGDRPSSLTLFGMFLGFVSMLLMELGY